jgi:hypothetical protein
MYGGSEKIVVEVACALAADHEVTVRLPYRIDSRVWRGVRWVGPDHQRERYDRLFCFDDFERRDDGEAVALVACRSDRPRHTDFSELVFLSEHHAKLMGHPGRPAVGGGVALADYATSKPRLHRRVICTSSPDRCRAAPIIGAAFDFVHSYRPVAGCPPTVELDRDGLRDLQQTAQVLIYPLDPIRSSDFFSMAVLEALAAGTPVVVSDADSMLELWNDAAAVLSRPIDYGEWMYEVEDLLTDRGRWKRQQARGLQVAARYDWPLVAQRYLGVFA